MKDTIKSQATDIIYLKQTIEDLKKYMDNQISVIMNKFNNKLESQAIEINIIKQSIPDQQKSMEIKITQITNKIEAIIENQADLKEIYNNSVLSMKKTNELAKIDFKKTDITLTGHSHYVNSLIELRCGKIASA